MGPENKFDPNAFTLFLGDTPIARGEIALAEITVPDEATEPPKGLDVFRCVEFTMTVKTPKRWRCQSRKRFIKLMMSEGIGRNHAEWMADFVRGWMPYREAWREYIWKKL
ncbi:hypothetical protein D1159_00330 [Pseudoflavonifractor sp. 524-17]|uniref:hypothetical protein n=1 Tax=Pseudoflavonifractor sp. 524-17 TaxID=2304577 RepID=UPI00137AC899|nr:hypothetical protein [Pseudoflavonifractor sp. 524-17]NCE63058.1 hypothetical protein [Pseudoflavonifractor sp. 524-17]